MGWMRYGLKTRAGRFWTGLWVALVVAVLLPGWGAASEPPPAEPQASLSQGEAVEGVARVNVNLRTGPGAGHGIQRVLLSGERVSLLGRSEDGVWLAIRTTDGAEGWAMAQYIIQVDPTNAPVSVAAPETVEAVPASQARVTAIGDSVMLGASVELARVIPHITVDAAVSRQVSHAISILQAKAAAGQLSSVVLVHVGTNGTFTAAQFDTIMRIIGEERRVVFVNVKVPRGWQGGNNSILASKVEQYPNAGLVDWHSASFNRPDFFSGDGIHLSGSGMRAYAYLIAATLGDW